MTEIWAAAVNNTVSDISTQARHFETVGFDGCAMSDSQNIRMECWVALTVAATCTRRLRLGTMVTNSLTRHVAVTAGAAATLQEVAEGRFVLGVGRGDSALANIGYGPAPIRQFETFLRRLQSYLRGQPVGFDREEVPDVPLASELGYQSTPEVSRIVWLPSAMPKVPVNVVASGRRVLRLGALLADEVTMVLGGDLELLTSTLTALRAYRSKAGLDPDGLDISAMIPVAVDRDPDRALQRINQQVGELGRWMSLQGGQPTELDETSDTAFRASVAAYDMNRHGPAGSAHRPAVTNAIDPSVLHRHGIAGPPETVADRLRPLLRLGLKRLILSPSPLFENEVLPYLRDEARPE